jgi:hypothetical protein
MLSNLAYVIVPLHTSQTLCALVYFLLSDQSTVTYLEILAFQLVYEILFSSKVNDASDF